MTYDSAPDCSLLNQLDVRMYITLGLRFGNHWKIRGSTTLLHWLLDIILRSRWGFAKRICRKAGDFMFP
jgi:hypothetical protein